MQENISNSHETVQQELRVTSHASLDERLGSGLGAQSLPNSWQLEPIAPGLNGYTSGPREANQFLRKSGGGPRAMRGAEMAGKTEARGGLHQAGRPVEQESLYGVKGRRDDSSSRDFNEDDANSRSARASLANFEENLKGDQIELKYFLSLSEQFNSFKVLKPPKQGANGSPNKRGKQSSGEQGVVSHYKANY